MSWRGLGAVLLATIFFCWPLLTQPVLPSGSDTSYHSQWAHGFVAGIGEGSLYPRWISDVNRGFGAPVFLIYPPLGYYAIALLQPFTGNVLESMRIVLIAAAFLAGLTFYWTARGRFSELGACFGAALYVLLPYHGLDLYDRFALAEYCAFPWIPPLFLAVRRLAERPHAGAWLLLAVSYTGLLFTHLMTGYLVLFVLGPYALWRLRQSGNWKALGWMTSAGLVGVLCAAVYVLPFVANRHQVHTDWFDEPHYDWRRNFIYRDEVAFGYRKDVVKPWADPPPTTQTILAVAAAGLLWVRRRKNSGSEERGTHAEGWVFAALALWTLFLQTPLSTPLWATVPQLAAAQFPWRFSGLQMLCIGFLCAAALSGQATAVAAVVTDKSRKKGRKSAVEAGPEAGVGRWASGTLVRSPGWTAVLLALAAIPALSVAVQVMDARPYTFSNVLARHPLYQYRVVKEFFPMGVEGWKEWESVPPPQGHGIVVQGTGTLSDVQMTEEARRFKVEAATPVRVVLRTFDYPGWRARVDGQSVPIRSEGPTKQIQIEVPVGSHSVEVVFEATGDRQWGAALSAIGVLILLAVFWVRRKGLRQGAGK